MQVRYIDVQVRQTFFPASPDVFPQGGWTAHLWVQMVLRGDGPRWKTKTFRDLDGFSRYLRKLVAHQQLGNLGESAGILDSVTHQLDSLNSEILYPTHVGVARHLGLSYDALAAMDVSLTSFLYSRPWADDTEGTTKSADAGAGFLLGSSAACRDGALKAISLFDELTGGV